mmetsp:Transcript_17947/g.45487  ORF Transcript_17947/g.45487 Transcript_17947/m.45487 type:complete len:193 (+) Transcript_17947:138-716(+)
MSFRAQLGSCVRSIRLRRIRANEYAAFVAAKNRLELLENSTTDELQCTLQERDVQFEDSESKDSLVRKIMVTDQPVGTKHALIVPGFGFSETLRAPCRMAPLAILRDRSCSHASNPILLAPSQLDVLDNTVMLCGRTIPLLPEKSYEELIALTMDHWYDRKELLFLDFFERNIPRRMWEFAVGNLVTHEADH